MAIYYFLCEAIPHADNSEREELAGAYINCWVKSTDDNLALKKAKAYIKNQGWEVINFEEQNIARRDRYEGDDELAESLECFDQAVSVGIAAIIYTWPFDEIDE